MNPHNVLIQERSSRFKPPMIKRLEAQRVVPVRNARTQAYETIEAAVEDAQALGKTPAFGLIPKMPRTYQTPY